MTKLCRRGVVSVAGICAGLVVLLCAALPSYATDPMFDLSTGMAAMKDTIVAQIASVQGPLLTVVGGILAIGVILKIAGMISGSK
jgi:hypothetical protein